MLRAASTATAPANRGTTVAAGRTRGCESHETGAPHSPPQRRGEPVTCGGSEARGSRGRVPVSRRGRAGAVQLAESA